MPMLLNCSAAVREIAELLSPSGVEMSVPDNHYGDTHSFTPYSFLSENHKPH